MAVTTQAPVHPLTSLSVAETNIARDVIRACHPGSVLHFRILYLQEPPKADLVKYLDLEHSGAPNADSARPARLARVHYDVVDDKAKPQFLEAVVDVEKRDRVFVETVKADVHQSFTLLVPSVTPRCPTPRVNRLLISSKGSSYKQSQTCAKTPHFSRNGSRNSRYRSTSTWWSNPGHTVVLTIRTRTAGTSRL